LNNLDILFAVLMLSTMHLLTLYILMKFTAYFYQNKILTVIITTEINLLIYQ